MTADRPPTLRPGSPTPLSASPCLTLPHVVPPRREHDWLRQFVGEWDSEIEMLMPAGQAPVRSRGVESAHMVGGYWLVSSARNLDFPYTCQCALGFEPRRGKYVGTWIDSMLAHLWHYTGEVDATGRSLVMDTEGPYPPEPDRIVRYRDVTEFASRDHRVFTSYRRLDDAWVPQLRIEFHRRAC